MLVGVLFFVFSWNSRSFMTLGVLYKQENLLFSILDNWGVLKMGISVFSKNMTFFGPSLLALILTFGVYVGQAGAQKFVLANPDLDQCANGSQGTPLAPCTGNNWQNGNLNSNNSQYVEGDSVSYRAIFTGTAGSAGSLFVEYDTTKSGKRALDYLTTFDRTNTLANGNNPCNNGNQTPHCSLGTFTTIPIPVDPDVTNGPNGVPGGGDDITQVPGVFTLFGGTITSVSGYSLSGVYTGDSTRGITVNFTFGPSGKVVLAWGGHISRRFDWGIGSTAIAIPGSPYHTTVNNGSNVSMQVEAVIVPASVTIVKLVTNLDLTYYSVFSFGFTTSTGAPTLPASFSLIDSNPAQFAGGSISNSSIVAFGAANTITVSENLPPDPYTLANVSCTEVGGGLPPVVNTTTNLATRTATIIPDEGEFITCTFSNTQFRPTAALVSIGGRVLTSDGAGIPRAQVTMVDQSGNTRSARTNPFGYYTFADVEIGQTYVVSVASKGYEFTPRIISLTDQLTDLDFFAF